MTHNHGIDQSFGSFIGLVGCSYCSYTCKSCYASAQVGETNHAVLYLMMRGAPLSVQKAQCWDNRWLLWKSQQTHLYMGRRGNHVCIFDDLYLLASLYLQGQIHPEPSHDNLQSNSDHKACAGLLENILSAGTERIGLLCSLA